MSIIAQGEISDQNILYYRNEKSFHIGMNSYGIDLGYQFGKRINYTERKLYNISISYIKDPKEQKERNPNTGGSYIFGKLNSVFCLRPTYGFQKEIFTKRDKGGISIKYFYSYGPSVALLKPIYYILADDEPRKFDESLIHSPELIEKKASFLKGINETKFVPGAFGKFGFNFEYSKQETVIHAIELGIAAELFIKKISVMATDVNSQQFFLILFVNYRLGKMVEPYKKTKNKVKDYLDFRQ